MWHVLDSDQEMLRDMTARFLADTATPAQLRKLRHDPAGFPADYWRQGCELGWTSLLVSEAAGGGSVSGRGAVDLALIAYEFGRSAAPGPLLDCNVVAAALSAQPTDTAREVLAGLLTGEHIAASALGWAPWQTTPTVTARQDGADWLLEGAVRPVESAAQASWLLVTALAPHGPLQALVRTDAPGVTVTPLKGLDVTRRFCAVSFAGVRVPAAALIGEPGQAAPQVAAQIANAAVILAAESVGAMDSAFNMTVDWAFQRYTFGRALASYQALKHRFADMKSWLEASHAVADAAAEAVADDRPDAAEYASAARSYIGVQGPELAQDCVQLHGGIGVTYEHDLHFFLRRVTLDSLLYGTPAEHRRLIAAAQIEKEAA